MNAVDEKLDEIALKQWAWKNQKLLTACLLIAEKAVQKVVFWPDDIGFDFLLSDDDRNVIGSAWRQCARNLGIIEKTGSFRRSKGDGANGRTIFQYRLLNKGVAMAFLNRYDKAKYLALAHPQLNLGI